MPDTIDPGEEKSITIGGLKGGGEAGTYVVVSYTPGRYEVGEYAEFAITGSGNLVAFDTNGNTVAAFDSDGTLQELSIMGTPAPLLGAPERRLLVEGRIVLRRALRRTGPRGE